MTASTSLAVDSTVTPEVNGSRQRIRLCAARTGFPPLLIVQGGPGQPLLHEVAKFQRLLKSENDFLVAYWEQRGCGDAPNVAAQRVSLSQQVDDLRTVVRWLHAETGQRVLVMGISWGATVALQAIANESQSVKSIVAISADLQTADNDAAALAFLEEVAQRTDRRAVRRRVMALQRPPYLELSGFQQRTRLLVDLGTIERGKRFGGLMRELLFDLIRSYGIAGSVRALRNMNTIQRNLLPEMAALDFFTRPPRVTVPVHYVIGNDDALTRASAAAKLPEALTPPNSTVLRVPDAGHMVHFDQSHLVQSLLARA